MATLLILLELTQDPYTLMGPGKSALGHSDGAWAAFTTLILEMTFKL